MSKTHERLALIIANSEFDDPKLSRLATPGRDAEALAEVLADPTIGGFEVTLLVDEMEPVVRRGIARLYHRRKKGDLLLLYYSGHGIRDEHSGELYLATRDTEMEIASATALDAAFVRGQIDKSGSQRKVVILDCCHSGAFARGAKAAVGSSADVQDAFEGSGYGRVILTASNAIQYAWEGDALSGEGAASVFTRFLVEGLRTGAADRNGDGQVSLDELYEYVYEQVLTSGRSRQTPQKWAQKVEGRVIIARNPCQAARPAELPPELLQAVESRLAGVRGGAVGELEGLLQGSDEGLALAAREALERLAEDDSRRVSAAAARALAVSPASSPAPPSPVVLREPRPNALTITSPIHLELVRVPAGEFLMGSNPEKDEEAYHDEQPQRRIHIPEFTIGKTPVTNAQYAAFVRAAGHEAPEHWKKGGKIPSGKEDHPVVYVSWDDAIAFCEWLSRETGRDFRLPSEAEWEKAARGTDGQIYPWGDDPPTAELCNFFGANVGDTTPVDRYSPQGDSPCGCADMVGNVWEWTQSLYASYPYDPAGGRENLNADGRRVLRGGAFDDEARCVRCAFRGGNYPSSRSGSNGFRVVAPPVASRL